MSRSTKVTYVKLQPKYNPEVVAAPHSYVVSAVMRYYDIDYDTVVSLDTTKKKALVRHRMATACILFSHDSIASISKTLKKDHTTLGVNTRNYCRLLHSDEDEETNFANLCKYITHTLCDYKSVRKVVLTTPSINNKIKFDESVCYEFNVMQTDNRRDFHKRTLAYASLLYRNYGTNAAWSDVPQEVIVGEFNEFNSRR